MEDVKLIPLGEENLEAYLGLSVGPGQEGFIETPEVSLRHMQTRAWDMDWTIECIFSGDTLAGYAMHGQNREGWVWLDRFMIDRKYQGRGLGHRALELMLALLRRTYPERAGILLSAEPENTGAIGLYEQYGFRLTGEMDGSEAVMELKEN